MNIEHHIPQWDAKIQALIDEYQIAGLAVALSDGKETLWHKGYGVTSTEKPWDTVTTQTLFRIASCTKLTVGLTTLKLVERGVLDLDTPITTYVPWLHMADESTLSAITLRRLLSHSAGLPSEYTPHGPLEESLLQAVIEEGFAQLRPIAHPDDCAYYYSNWGIRLVSCILQEVSGKSFTALVKEEILDPLGMDHTTFDLQVAATHSLAVGHDVGPRPIHHIPVNATRHAAGGLFSCVDDLVKLGRVILNQGAPFVKPETLAEMMTPQSNLHLNFFNRYGLTMRIKAYENLMLYGHDGQAPPYYASMWTLPQAGVCLAVTLNTEGGNPLSADLIPQLIFSTLCHKEEGAETAPTAWTPTPEGLACAPGTYLGDRQGIFTLESGDQGLCITLQGKTHDLLPLHQPGVFGFVAAVQTPAVGLDSSQGAQILVGIPATYGGSSHHIYINGDFCRRITLTPPPQDLDYPNFVGRYETALETFDFVYAQETLTILRKGEGYPCHFVEYETFSSALGVVQFQRTKGQVTGVRVGSSFVFPKCQKTTTEVTAHA